VLQILRSNSGPWIPFHIKPDSSFDFTEIVAEQELFIKFLLLLLLLLQKMAAPIS
jgi:hypothetical protein